MMSQSLMIPLEMKISQSQSFQSPLVGLRYFVPFQKKTRKRDNKARVRGQITVFFFPGGSKQKVKFAAILGIYRVVG